MATISTRDGLKNYALRQLGHPVVQVNLDDDQIEDCIDTAMQEYQDFHYDATEKIYLAYAVTANDIANTCIPISDGIIGVTRIFPLSSSTVSSDALFNLNYQLNLQMASQLQNMSATSAVASDYYQLKANLDLWDVIINGLVPIRFNRHMNKLYIDMDWTADITAGKYIIIEAFRVLDPNEYTKVYNDKWLKHYVTALMKKQWGTNMKKFEGVPLLGGVTMNGQKIYDEALDEIAKLEEDLQKKYSMPAEFFMG